VQAQMNSERVLQDYSNVSIKIFYQKQILFNANFADLLAKKVELLNLPAQSSKLYRLEFHANELEKDFQVNFDLIFLLNSENQLVDQEQKSEVLGTKTQLKEIQATQISVEDEKLFTRQNYFLFAILLFFLLLLFLLFLIYRWLVNKRKNIN
jgi:hypothetical protein